MPFWRKSEDPWDMEPEKRRTWTAGEPQPPAFLLIFVKNNDYASRPFVLIPPIAIPSIVTFKDVSPCAPLKSLLLNTICVITSVDVLAPSSA